MNPAKMPERFPNTEDGGMGDSKTVEATKTPRTGEHSDCGFTEDLKAYLDNELPLPGRWRMKSHLSHCSRCRGMLIEMERIGNEMKQVGAQESVLSPEMRSRLVAGLGDIRPQDGDRAKPRPLWKQRPLLVFGGGGVTVAASLLVFMMLYKPLDDIAQRTVAQQFATATPAMPAPSPAMPAIEQTVTGSAPMEAVRADVGAGVGVYGDAKGGSQRGAVVGRAAVAAVGQSGALSVVGGGGLGPVGEGGGYDGSNRAGAQGVKGGTGSGVRGSGIGGNGGGVGANVAGRGLQMAHAPVGLQLAQAPTAASRMPMTGSPVFVNAGEGVSADGLLAERQVHREASVGVAVPSVEQTDTQIVNLVEGAGGYIASNNLNTDESGYKYAELSVKVPVKEFDTILAEIAKTGDLRSKSISGEDITEKVSDATSDEQVLVDETTKLEERLKNSGMSEKRVAQTEEQIRETRLQLARTRARLGLLRKMATLSTIQVSLTEKAKKVAAKPEDSGFLRDLHETNRTAMAAFQAAVRVPIVMIVWILAFSPLWIPLIIAYRWASLRNRAR
jgi:hypothetical protein